MRTDRDEVNALAYDGLAILVGQPLPPSIWGHNPELDANAIQYDPNAPAPCSMNWAMST